MSEETIKNEKFAKDRNLIYDSTNEFWLNEWTNAKDSYNTALYLLQRESLQKWKWVTVVLHHALYSTCVAIQTYGLYENVLSYKELYQKKGMGKWKKLTEEYINDDKIIFKIKWVEVTDEENNKLNQQVEEFDKQNSINFENFEKSKLLSFSYVFARVMDDEYFMSRYTFQEALFLSEEDLLDIQYIHQLRNKFMHYKPELAVFEVDKIRKALIVYVNSIEFLSKSIAAQSGEFNKNDRKTISEIKNYLAN